MPLVLQPTKTAKGLTLSLVDYANMNAGLRDERGGGGGGMDGPVGAGGPDVAANTGAPAAGVRRKLKLAPRSKPVGATDPAVTSGAGSDTVSAKKASIFGGGKAHDEFAYEVRLCAVGWGRVDRGELIVRGG